MALDRPQTIFPGLIWLRRELTHYTDRLVLVALASNRIRGQQVLFEMSRLPLRYLTKVTNSLHALLKRAHPINALDNTRSIRDMVNNRLVQFFPSAASLLYSEPV